MPDMTPVATMVKVPDPNQGLNTLSSILNYRQAQQNLQTGAIQQQGIAANVQQEQQKNRELQAAQQIAINGAKSGQYDDGSGGLDRQKMANDILRVAPTYGQGQISSLLSQANEVVANKQAHQNLTVSQKKEMGDTFASLASDPSVDNTKFIDAVEKLRQAHNNDPEFSRMLTSMTTHYPGTASSDQQRQILGRWSAAATGEPQTAPGQMDTGTQIQPGGVNRFGQGFTPAGQPINKQNVVTTPAGPLAVATPATGALRPLGGQNLNTTHAQQENVQGMAQDDRGRYAQVSQEGSNATTGAQLADDVSRLAEQVRTGKLSKEWTDRLTTLQQHDPNLTARQMLSKYAAQLKTMATAGATTDASRSQIDEGMPSPETMGPDAVKEAAQYVGGIFRMRGARQEHADRYTQNNGNSIGIREADDAFMRAADPTVFAYKSLPAGQERQDFLRKHGLTSQEKIDAFRARLNQVNHYSGGQ
jgi:hypothetical protein